MDRQRTAGGMADRPEWEVAATYRPGQQPEALHHPASVRGSGVVVGFELVMARIWT
ncbi:hypothetical protein [Granulicella arctica]|uniref:Uncharacterized protein n=1 Tax=Granulicella arctica TaxID=940613 RepID=A0A7Y9PGS9_9BACT|nr:hypothetical protein [Granulicella arctica]NYF79440.1 hypothetical protein [Granulicella arctica]